MDKTLKIGKNALDIFAPTITPGTVPPGTTKSTLKRPATAKEPNGSPKTSGSIEVAREATQPGRSETLSGAANETGAGTRGRPPLHQEPASKITTVLLNRHVVYLDGISNKIRQQSGAVVKRSEILRALVEALEAAQPDLHQVRSQADLTEMLRLRLGT